MTAIGVLNVSLKMSDAVYSKRYESEKWYKDEPMFCLT